MKNPHLHTLPLRCSKFKVRLATSSFSSLETELPSLRSDHASLASPLLKVAEASVAFLKLETSFHVRAHFPLVFSNRLKSKRRTRKPAPAFQRTKGERFKGNHQRFRRVSTTPLANTDRTNELGSGTLARRNPMVSPSADGGTLEGYKDCMVQWLSE